MKKKNLVVSLAALALLAGAAGASSALAANTDSAGPIRGQKQLVLSETQKAEMDAKFAAVQAALTAGDYDAWVAAEKALNEDCPMLEKVTAANFSQYAKAYSLRAQADSLLAEIGIETPGGHGPGRGEGFGHGQRGLGFGHNQAETATE
jgi:Skp family chaperone for outer membrane proteins